MGRASRLIYLHGFASSAASRKAVYLGQRLRDLGFSFEAPDLAEGDFQRLTISNQLLVVDRLNPRREPVGLIGSSLGGFVAATYAVSHPEVTKLVLLAPAFNFHDLWLQQLGAPALDSWRQNGSMSVFHYGKGRDLRIGYQLFEDAGRYPGFPEFAQPALIFHGDRDPVVPVDQSVGFAERHANVKLVRLQSGHELTDVLDSIWLEMREFLDDVRCAGSVLE